MQLLVNPYDLENQHTSPYIIRVRVALISTPFCPVPPPKYGGTELIVYHLARDLAARGHDVILYSTGSSKLPGVDCRSLYREAIWPPDPWHELNHAGFAMRDIAASEPVDIIHAHLAPALALAPFMAAPVIYTVHHVREEPIQSFYAENAHPNVHFVAISERQQQLLLPEVTSTVVHHGLDVDAYPLGHGGSYAAFLGRFAVEKGPAVAIDVAERAGVPIRLGGEPHWKDMTYFRREVEPRLARHGVTWLGELGHRPKCLLFGAAAATLCPIDWEEPFGLVFIESMLCGTPILAFARGSAPELIDDGVTGWVCADAEEMAARLAELHRNPRSFDREACRRRAVERFSVAHMTAGYLDVYTTAMDAPALASVDAR